MPLQIPLLVIAGPTATGKTAAALRVARAVGGEIVSADSMQIYRLLEIGTAKPTPAERAAARFHLVDCVGPDEPYTVAEFQHQAQQAIVAIWGRGNLPIVCGGTGLYIRALVEHFAFPGAEPPDRQRIRQDLTAELARVGSAALHGRLAAVDPPAAARIPPGDARRIIRALEVFLLSGEPMTRARRVDARPALKYNLRYFVVDRPRSDLYAGIEARIDRMLARGWLDEARALRARGFDRELQALRAIGYRHLLAWLATPETARSARGFADTVAQIKQDTRRYAKRQLTWFRRETQARWRVWSDRDGFDALLRELCREAQSLVAAAGGGSAQ